MRSVLPNLPKRAYTREPLQLGRIGPLKARLAVDWDEVRAAQKLRHRVFFQELGARGNASSRLLGRDRDSFDRHCDHLLVLDNDLPDNAQLVGTYRALDTGQAAKAGGFYSETEFDLTALKHHYRSGKMLELGRSCVAPDHRSKRVMELMWQGVWALAVARGADVLFGCASFSTTDPETIAPSLGWLSANVMLDEALACTALTASQVELRDYSNRVSDTRRSLAAMPPLLKGYLRLGARIGSQAVIDHQFGTTDVLVVLDVKSINPRYINYYGADASRFAA